MNIFKKLLTFVMDILETIIFVGSIFIVIYLFILSPHQVKGASMEPTFENGDYILTSKIIYKMRGPEQDDVVVFKSPKNPEIDFIKRVIALHGQKVKIINSTVLVDGHILQEPYISAPTTLFEGGFIQNGIETTVPEGYLFVMGDNRPRSSDSRDFGFIPVKDVIGKVFFRYFPPQKIGVIKNE
ncbi:MAG TPA: signal peptidase I [Patescibacteria group bacterium]|nr:signal peptidase I [Patescibacteria group bacterium]